MSENFFAAIGEKKRGLGDSIGVVSNFGIHGNIPEGAVLLINGKYGVSEFPVICHIRRLEG